MRQLFSLFVLLSSLFLAGSAINAQQMLSPDVKHFIKRMVEVHSFDHEELTQLFSKVNISPVVLKSIQRPFEKSSWRVYRKRFLSEVRINEGLRFWEEYAPFLQRAEREFGVPQQIIVAIIGVESLYGKNVGRHYVLQALSTLAFRAEARKKFFLTELEEFLLLCREQNWDPSLVKGSYAGAMGLPQFISSSYRRYAIDFNQSGAIDLISHAPTAIGSVANYFNKFGWVKNAPIVVPAKVINNKYIQSNVVVNQAKPSVTVKNLNSLGIKPITAIAKTHLVSLLMLDEDDPDNCWVGLENFHVLTKYNNSNLYAMAVYDLSVELARRYYHQ